MSRVMLFGLMSWLILASAAPARADDAEDKAVAFVEKLGGKVTRDQKQPGKPVVGVSLSFTKVKVTDADLKELAAFKNLSVLALYMTGVTDRGMTELTTFKTLTRLTLGSTKVTDTGMKELSKLTSLIELDLSNNKVTDAGLKELSPLTNLASLNLSHTEVTDAGLKDVAALQRCFNPGGAPIPGCAP